MHKATISLLGVIFLLAAVTVTRTYLHRPDLAEDVPRVTIAVDPNVIAEHLSAAIQFRTVSHQSTEAIDWDQFEAFVAWVQNTYPELNDAMELTLLGNHTMLYRWRGTNAALQPILLTAHYDVVPVIPGTEDRGRYPPVSGMTVDGVIWGRGALDDKSAVVAQLEAATVLIQSGYEPKRTVYFSFGHDEELGGHRGARNVADYLEHQGTQLAWSLDEGSFLYDDLLPGVDPLIAAINVAEKGSVTVDIVARSAGGHSSMPPYPTTVGILAEAITRLEANPMPGELSGLSARIFDATSRYLPFGRRIPFANLWLFSGVIEDRLSAVDFGNALLRTTTAPTMLSASVKVNVLPIEAVATVNFRLHPRDSPEDVIDHVKSVIADNRIEVRPHPGAARPASTVSDWHSQGYSVIERAILEVYGRVIVTPGLMIAASDSRHYGKVADNAFRFNPMIVSQKDLTGFHGTDESISVANLAQGTRTYVQILRHGTSE